LNIRWVRTPQKILDLNIYLDKEIIETFNRKKRTGINLNPLNYHNDYNKQELHETLIEHQDGFCPICIEALKHTSAKELDHEPSIYQLRENILRQLICKLKLPAGGDSKLVVYKKLLKLSDIDVENAIVSELRSNLFLRSVHRKCHKTIDRDLGLKEKAWRKEVKKETNEEFYHDIVKFRDNIKVVIKRHKKTFQGSNYGNFK
jgi:hypothetical protein